MKSLARNLVPGMQGTDVRELQRALAWLNFEIQTRELERTRLGESTLAAVQALQKQNRLKPDGVVEQKTVAAINKRLGALKRIVRGTVRQVDGKPIARAKVRAFDKDLRKETVLGEATCNSEGYFEIAYVFGDAVRGAPNLVVKGFATARAAKAIAESSVVFEAPPDLIVDLSVGTGEFRGLSEFERVMRDIKPVIDRQRTKLANLTEDDKNQDVTFLSRQIKQTPDRVTYAVLAHRHAEQSGLEPEIFYAFLRQGLPGEASMLLSQGVPALRGALVAAVKDNIIPQGFETDEKLKGVLDRLDTWRVSVALQEPADPKQVTLGKVIKGVLTNEAQQQRFMRTYAEHSGSIADFWKKLEEDAQLSRRAAELKFAVLLTNLGRNYLPLVDAVRSRRELKELKDLASLNEDAWYALIIERRVGTPAGIEGTDDADKARKYARALAVAVEAAAPTEFFVARLKEAEVEGKADLLTFFKANPGFDIKRTALRAFIKANPAALNGLSDAVRAEKRLRGLQRAYRLAPSFRAAMALQQAGKDSAHRISSMGRNTFVGSFSGFFDDVNQAQVAYAKARQVSASAIALFADVNPSANVVSMHAVPDVAAREIADLQAMFGPLDSCSCVQCQSVCSPSAYLVDVLQYLSERRSRVSSQYAKDVLFERRPDLGEIELSCENANTLMPYVDLVLEILEDAVAPPSSMQSRQTSGTTQERAANPQYINAQAYETLADSVFPWTLPLDLSLEEARIYLGHLRVPRHEIMEAFLPGKRSDVLANVALAVEYLSLSKKEAALICGVDPATLWVQWGFKATDAVDDATGLGTITNIEEWLDRSGLTYPELLDLLQTQYVDPGHTLDVVAIDEQHADPCNLANLQLQGLTVDIAGRATRFVRLRRRLDWTMFELDLAIRALGGELNADFLVKLSHLCRLHGRFNLPVGRLAAFSAPLAADFSDDLLSLSGKLIAHIGATSAALGINAAEVHAFVENVRVCPQGIDTDLNTESVSQVHRHAVLAKALRLPIPDYLRALELIDASPFASTLSTLLFVENVMRARESGFSFAEMDYLLRHRSEAASGIALEDRVIVDRLGDLRQELQKGATKEAIARKLAEILDLEMSVVSVLESRWTSLIDAAVADAGIDINPGNLPRQFEDWVRLHKISIVAARLDMNAATLGWLLPDPVAGGLLDLKTLPVSPAAHDFQSWMRLIDLLKARAFFMTGASGLLELLSLAKQSTSSSSMQAEFLDTLAEQTDWRRADLDYLVGAADPGLTFPDDFVNAQALLRLRDCFTVMNRLGMSAEQSKALSRDEVAPETAQGVRQAVRAKYDDAQWLTIAKPLRDVLREKQRSSLVDYLVAHRSEMGWNDANDLYAHFLIDVEMAPCMMTSRIKQAISSVQLFVQRCLMNLEDGFIADVEHDDAWDWWQWMKNYRVWEANRKIFLHPENWIEPELRDDKSPFFRELESELMEGDLTQDSARTAFLNFLEKLGNVGRPLVMAVHHQKEEGKLDILHVIARTRALPHTYYYRQRVDAAWWTPWEKVDFDIEGGHLIPVVWNRRFFLFWPVFTEKAGAVSVTLPSPANGNAVSGRSSKSWEMKLAWSERRQDHWLDKKISSNAATIEAGDKQELPDPSKIFFVATAGPRDLEIVQAFVTERGHRDVLPSALAKSIDPINAVSGDYHVNPGDLAGTLANDEVFGTSDAYVHGLENRFLFRGCSSDPVITSLEASMIGRGQNVLAGTRRSYMYFQEQAETALNLPVRKDVDNSMPGLAQTPGSTGFEYTVVTHGAAPRVSANPFVFQDSARSYLVVPKLSWWDETIVDPGELDGRLALARAAASSASIDHTAVASPAVALAPDSHSMMPFVARPNTKYTFQALYHPYVCAFVSILNLDGVDQLLRREVQREPHKFVPGNSTGVQFDFAAEYAPTDLVAAPYPVEEIDFSSSGAYSSYNWELFFHAPLLIADRLSKNQRFAEAVQWFHYIFNPTDTSAEPHPRRYWQTREFFDRTEEGYQRDRLEVLFTLLARASELRAKPNPTAQDQEDLRRVIDIEASIKAWRDKPFSPHLIARMRTTAYQKAVVMKYIDNLIAWGDHLFRQDTIESINEATQLYVLAADILGKRPVEIPARDAPRPETYNSLEGRLDEFANALVELEEIIPVDPDPGADDSGQPAPAMLYFCLPKNDKLLRYWDTVADRLFKIRHCMNIEGVVRQLPLFDYPIDPALLVRAAAAGVDLNSLLSDSAASLPLYRFSVLAQKATELCGELRSLGATLLATLEKRDAEELSLLRAKHESGLLDKIEQVRERQLAEAKEQLEVLSASREVVVGRLGHYQRLLGESNPGRPEIGERVQEKERPRFSEIQNLAGVKMFPHEALENSLLGVAQGLESLAATQEFLGAVLHLIPHANLMFMGVGVTVAGVADAQRAGAVGNRGLASVAQFGANLTGRLGSYIARELDWVLQHNQSAREIAQIDKQIAAAQIRREIADLELRNHRRQVANAVEVETLLRDKYTNQDLYSWMVGQMSGVYFQAYQLAYETARRTEECYRYELGIEDSAFIKFGYWDSLKKGLLAGDKLHQDLKRMEVAYLEANERDFEITKHISLSQLDPQALLQLKTTGTCSIEVPEAVFDLDHPGHYRRRHKSVSLSIPCVAGPFTSVSCKLSLISSRYRKSTALRQGVGTDREKYQEQAGIDYERFAYNVGAIQSISTSSGQSDSGMFELNFRDERYLPFEGTGAIGTWQLELPAAFRQFDYGTISDVILHLRYTARDGGTEFRDCVESGQRELLNEMMVAANRNGLFQAYNLRQQFPNEWGRLKQANTTQLTLGLQHLPFLAQGHSPTIDEVTWLARVNGDPATYEISIDGASAILSRNADLANLCTGSSVPVQLGTPFALSTLDAGILVELTMLVHYTLGS